MFQNNNKSIVFKHHMDVMEDGQKIALLTPRSSVSHLEVPINILDKQTTANTMVETLRSMIMNIMK